jgi:NH3-dependent NAD+ synthetase
MSEKDKLYRNLTILLKIFKNRPNHLSKYLLENSAFSDEFLEKLLTSDKLNKLTSENTEELFIESYEEEYFTNFDEMDSFYLDILEKSSAKDNSQIESDFNNKLKKHLSDEEYEMAAKIRDYMIRNKINIWE